MIGNYSIEVPYTNDGMRIAVLSQWHVDNGSIVEEGQIICTIDCDGEEVDISSWNSGKLNILVEAGSKCAVRQLLAFVEADITTLTWHEPMNVELSFEMQKKIEGKRGDETRGRFLRRIVQEFIDKEFG